MALTITKKFDENSYSWMLDIVGEIDLNAAPNFKSTLNQCIEEKPANIILNCEALTFIDSTGLGVMINIYKKISDNYNITISKPRDNVKKIFEITGLSKFITITP